MYYSLLSLAWVRLASLSRAGDANGAFVESATVILALPSNKTPFIVLALVSFVALLAVACVS